jgi:tripartite-type tricarboxylate transporter receptor subunit TctC
MKILCYPVLVALMCFANAAQAQSTTYPERPIKLVVPWPAGGGTDAVSRHVAAAVSQQLKQQVVVDNRPGANGIVGTEALARALPNGYTLGIATAETHAINPHVYKKLSYSAQKDFTAIAWVGHFPYALATRPDLGVSDVAGLVALARKQPGKLSYASWGVGSSSQIAFEMFKQAAKVDMLHVPYQGAAPALTALAANQVDVLMVPLSVALPQRQGGRLNLLGLAAPKRLPAAPDLPTLIEQGFPVEGGTWLAVMGPAGLPSSVVSQLNRAVNTALDTTDLRDTLIKLGVEPLGAQPNEVQKRIEAESQRWSAVIRTAGVQLEQ